MSFKLFIYYCALCGGWAAFLGWAIGIGLASAARSELAQDLLMGTFLGLTVALALGVTDAVWNLSGHRYGQIVTRGLFIGLVGALAGLIGTAIGSALFSLTNVEVLRIAGWVVVGVLIGASVGLYDFVARRRAGDRSGGGLRKLLNGVIGGTLGGGVGAVLFVLLRNAMGSLLGKPPSDLLSGSAIGFVALGACIGLFIGLAQVILKEAWIEIEVGRRAGRQMILSKDETTIGRAEGCDVGLFGDSGVEKNHARIVLDGGRYLLADAGTPGGTFLNDERVARPTPLRSGDAIRVGACVLRFGERQKKK